MNARLSALAATAAAELGRVAVLLGGVAAERQVSLDTGNAVLAALRQRQVDAVAYDPAERPLHEIAATGADRVFIALHGRGGEDGVCQGVLESLRLPYTGSGVLGSALAMDKLRAKQLWQAVGLPTPPAALCRNWDDARDAFAQLGGEVILKPVHEGSSIGMSRVDAEADLSAAWDEARRFDTEVLMERWIDGGEYTVAIVAGSALPAIHMTTPRRFYDYTAKYLAQDTRYDCPCGLPEAREQALRARALAAFDALGADGWGRVDFMMDGQGEPWLLEVNTVPGMTGHSLVPMAAQAAGLSFAEVVVAITALTLENRP